MFRSNRSGMPTNSKRERPHSQERLLELESRPSKRVSTDDAPEEGELEDDIPSLPPRPTTSITSPNKSKTDDFGRENRLSDVLGRREANTANERAASGSVSNDQDHDGSLRGPSGLSTASATAKPLPKKVAFPFKKKDKPNAVVLPALASDSDFGAPEGHKERKDAALPPPHPSLPAPPVFATASLKDEERRGRKDTSPGKRDRELPRQSRERDGPHRARDREYDRERRGYDEYGRDSRPSRDYYDREREADDRHHRSGHHSRGYDTWASSSDRPLVDDWRTRPEDDPYDSRDYRDRRGRDVYYHDDDRDKDHRSYRPVSPSRSHRDSRRVPPNRSTSPANSSRSRVNRPPPPSRSPRSRSRSRSCSTSSSRSRMTSRTPSAQPHHAPSRLPRPAAQPSPPPALPRSLGRDDEDLDDPLRRPPAASSEPTRAFQPFNIRPKGEPLPGARAALPPPPSDVALSRGAAAPLPNYEPKSLPPSTIAGAASSSVHPSIRPKNILGDEEEDEGEVKEDVPRSPKPRKLPELPPLSTPLPGPPHGALPPGDSGPKVLSAEQQALADAVEKKIREMEASAGVPPPVPPPQVIPPPKEKAAFNMPEKTERRPLVRRPAEQEKVAYGRNFVGVSRLAMYRKQDKLGEGTFGEVFKATHVQTQAVVALKRILMHNENQGVPITAVREIKLLKTLKHPNVVELVDIVMEPPSEKDEKGSIYMVFPYMDHDLAGLLENSSVSLSASIVKLYMKQLLEGTAYLHRNNILHRDIKAANLLISNDGCLKIADFGLARPISKEWADKRGFTNCVVTRWYRPPELLMGAKVYTGAVDLWGCGCILAEMFERKPILMGDSDMGQLDAIFQLCGSPNDDVWTGWKELPGCEGYEVKQHHVRTVGQRFRMLSNDTCDLIIALLALDPSRRLTADEALDHQYFWTDPLPADPKNLPNWNASKEYDRRKKMEMQQQQQQQQRGLPPPVHYQPQQPQGGFNVGRQHHRHGGGFNNGSRGQSHQPPKNQPPPRLADGLPPGIAPPLGGGNNQRGQNRQQQPHQLPPLRWDSSSSVLRMPVPSSLPPHPSSLPPQQGLPQPAYGGPGGYKGPLIRGGQHPERPYAAGPGSGSAMRLGPGPASGRRDGGSHNRGGGGGGGGLPYD